MAQLVFSSIGITGIRGRIGGTQFTRVVSGPQATRPTIPRQPKTSYQQEAQKKLREVQEAWQELGNTNRESWQKAVETGDWDRTNSLGEIYTPTAQSLFLELNLNAYDFSFPILEGPTFPTLTALNLTEIEALDSGDFYLTFSVEAINEGEAVEVYATPNLPPGRFSLIQDCYKKIGYIRAADFSEVTNIREIWEARFGQQIVGCSVFVRTFIMEEASGAKKQFGNLRTIVTSA